MRIVSDPVEVFGQLFLCSAFLWYGLRVPPGSDMTAYEGGRFPGMRLQYL